MSISLLKQLLLLTLFCLGTANAAKKKSKKIRHPILTDIDLMVKATTSVGIKTPLLEELHGIKSSVIETIGNTPIVRLNRTALCSEANIYVKLEFFSPGGSIKDRLGAWCAELGTCLTIRDDKCRADLAGRQDR